MTFEFGLTLLSIGLTLFWSIGIIAVIVGGASPWWLLLFVPLGIFDFAISAVRR